MDSRDEVQWSGRGQWAREMRLMKREDELCLRIVYPLGVKYRFTDQLLHHLVATINKSALHSFIARLEDSPQLPLLTLYCTLSLTNPTQPHIRTPNAPPSKLLALPDLIYHKILLLCEAYTIEHSPLAKGHELIEFIAGRAQQQRLFLEQLELLTQTPPQHHQEEGALQRLPPKVSL